MPRRHDCPHPRGRGRRAPRPQVRPHLHGDLGEWMCRGQRLLIRRDARELCPDLANLGIDLLESELLHVAVRSPEAPIKDEGEGSLGA
jgi:hypothetical protein